MSVAPGIDSTATATLLARGICRALDQLGYASLVEFPLINGRRADILGLGKAGDLLIVEIKSSVADFRADRKWRVTAILQIVFISRSRTTFRKC